MDVSKNGILGGLQKWEIVIRGADAITWAEKRADVPAAPDLCAKLLFQLLNLLPVQLPEVGMVVQSMPCFYRGNLPFQVDARRQVQQLLDDGAARGPGGVELGRIGRSGHQWRRGHHHVACRVGRRRVLIGEVGHAWVFQREDEIDGYRHGLGWVDGLGLCSVAIVCV